MAFLFVSIAAIDVSVCKEQPILMWLQPYIDLICRNFTVLPPSSEEPGAAESPKPDTVDQTTTEVPEFVGDCESATTELYNAYVCGFIILLCIDVLLFVQLPKNHCRVAPQPCNSSYCKSSCSKNTECSCCPKESKGTRLKKRLIKCIDYHRFRQCASMQSASSCSTIGPCGPGCTHGSCCGAGGAPCTQGDGPATCCASKPMIPGGPFTPAHGPGATYPIIPVSAKKSSMPAGPSCGGPSGGGPAPHGPGPGGPGPCGSGPGPHGPGGGPGPHGPGGGPGPHGPAPGGAGGCGSSPGPHGPGPGGPGACGGGPPSHGPGPGGAGACGSGPASHGPAPGGAGACGGAPRPHGPGPGGPGACGGGPAPHGPGPHSGTPGGPHGGPHGPGPDHAGPHGGPHGGPYRPGPAGPFGGRPGPGNVGAHDIAGGGQSPCNPGQQSPGCQKSADPGPQGQSHPGESCNSKGPCAGEESPHGPNAEAPCDSKPCGLGVGGPSGPNRGGPCPEQADENISESNAPCDSGGASPAPLAGGGGSTQDDQKSIFSTQTTPRALMPPNSGPRSGMDPYNVKFSPSVRDSSSKAPFPSGPGPGHHNAASNFPGSPPDHRGHIVNNQYNTTANPKSGPPNTSFPPANTMRDQDPRNPSGGQYPPMHYNQGNRGPVPNPRTIGQYNAPPENVYDSAPASPQLPQPNTQRKCGGGMNNYQQETDTISKTDSDYYREKSPFDTSSLSESMYSDRPSLCPKFSGILSNDNDTSRCSEQIIATQMIIQDRTVAKTASPRRITEKKHLTIQENPVARKTSASNAGRKIQQVVNERSKCKDDMDVKISAPKTQSSGEMNPNKSPSCIVCLKPISSTEPSKSEIEDKERKLTEIACTSSQLSSQPTTMSPKESGEYSSTDTSRTATPKRKGAFKKTSKSSIDNRIH
ncbi:collagen alpha-1(III) chain-like [Ctenocephalides felis]|uniref:collagen alpha-1(III) chain-like n=1 Tax=Ctenocephalides felis TaxID=7515 RepID=UPI000E6E554D|nr:collagen alpha-1(III) chain-like [Ctenocephalides felis]